jgi:hypothetical protein
MFVRAAARDYSSAHISAQAGDPLLSQYDQNNGQPSPGIGARLRARGIKKSIDALAKHTAAPIKRRKIARTSGSFPTCLTYFDADACLTALRD